MKTFNLLFIFIVILHVNNLFAQTNVKTKNLSVEITQSIVYLGNMNYLKNSEYNMYSYSPGVNMEFRFLKKYIAVFGGVEYYQINSKKNYYQPPFYSITTQYGEHGFNVNENIILNYIEVPLGFKIYFLKDKFKIQPYMSFGTLLKYYSIKSNNTYFDISTSSYSYENDESNYKYISRVSNNYGLNFILLSVGCNYKFKNNFLINFEVKTKYNCIFPTNYMLISTLGLKYEFL